MDVGERLSRLVQDQACPDIAELLLTLDRGETETARSWFAGGGRRAARQAVAAEYGTLAQDCLLVLSAGLARTPREAVRDFAWGTAWWWDVRELLPLVDVLVSRGRDWCRDFVDLGSRARIPSDVPEAAAQMVEVALPLVSHFGLPVPPGEQYPLGWAQMVAALRAASSRDQNEHAWIRGGRLVVVGPGGRARQQLPGSSPFALRQVVDLTPGLQDTLVRVLGTPTATGYLTDGSPSPGWSLPATVRDLVADGRVEREALVGAALAELTGNDSPTSQRATCTVLTGLDFGPADALAHLNLLLHVMPIAHGWVTSALLPTVLAADLPGDALLDLGTTILGRKEKAQKVTLVRHLTGQDPRTEAAVELLELAADSDDRALAGKASSALARRRRGAATTGSGRTARAAGGVAATPAAVTARALDPQPRRPAPFRPVEPSPAGLAELISWPSSADSAANVARWLDLVTRWGAQDAEALRRALATPRKGMEDLPVRDHLFRWGRCGQTRMPTTWTSMSITSTADGTVEHEQRTYPVRHAPEVWLTNELTTETLERLGATSQLLSTPSREDATLSFADLVDRIRAVGADGYAPFDLLQALLRLEPTSPARLSDLDGLRLPPATGDRSRGWGRLGRLVGKEHLPLDGVEVVRAWVHGGGVPVRTASFLDAAPHRPVVGVPAVVLPTALPQAEVLAPLLEALDPPASDFSWERQDAHLLGVIPSWAETAAAVSSRTEGADDKRPVSRVVASPGVLGPAVHLLAARLLTHARADCRASGAEMVLSMAREGRLEDALLHQATQELMDNGRLSLARTAAAWEQVALAGGLGAIWSSVSAVLHCASSAPRTPAGLADALRTMAPYVAGAAGQLAAPLVPDGVRALARRRGASKAVLEAQVFVATVDAASTPPPVDGDAL